MKSIIVLCEYFLCFIFFRNSAVSSIKEGIFDGRFFPKHFTLPSRFIRKIFNLKKVFIPKYLNFRLYVSIIFGILAPIVALMALAMPTGIVGLLILGPAIFVILDTLQFVIFSRVFAPKKRK